MKPSLLRNYLFLSLGVTLLFFLLGAFALQVFQQIRMSKFENNPPLFFTRLIDEAKPADRDNLLRRMKSDEFPFDVWLFTQDGSVRGSSTDKPLPIKVDKVDLPHQALETTSIHSFWQQNFATIIVKLHGEPASYLVFSPRPFSNFGHRPPGPPGELPPGPPPGLHNEMFAGPPPGGPGFGPPPGPPGEEHGPRGGPSLLFPLIIFIIAILLACGVSVLILFIYIKKTSILADTVLDDLKKGNLRARFPVTKMNEVGNLMTRFNLMADEVEKLFTQLREKEISRTRLLQELAHDLRTPVASMQNMLGLLLGDKNAVSESTKVEMLGMSHRESLYIGQLINDLLLLSQIAGPEPAAKNKGETDLIALIESELEAVQTLSLVNGEKIKIINETEGSTKNITCDSHLLKRLFRNVFDNAYGFARSKIVISSKEVNGAFEVTVEDDGPGFSEEALRNYGERKITRIVGQNMEGRISVGLGSVIIKAIAQIHGAEVIAGNVKNSDGKTIGAQIRIRFSNNFT